MKKILVLLFTLLYSCVITVEAQTDSENSDGFDEFPILINRSETALNGVYVMEGATVDDMGLVTYASDIYRFQEPLTKLRFTVKESGGNQLAGSYPFFSLSSFELFDEDGNEIELTEDMLYSNADHNRLNPNGIDGGGLAALIDDDGSTYFHSTWMTAVDDYHYLEVTLPTGEYSAFSFAMTARATSFHHQFPAVLEIDTLSTREPGIQDILSFGSSLTLTTADGLPGTLSGSQYFWESPMLWFDSLQSTIRLTVIETTSGNVDNDEYGLPCFALAEFFMTDSLGYIIELTEDMITTNACHNTMNSFTDGDGIAGMLDGDPSTYFHSTWGVGADGYHYIQISLPDGGYDCFSFGFISRKNKITPRLIELSFDGKCENDSSGPVVSDEFYTLTFMLDDEVYHTDSLSYGATVVVPEVPVREGYTFSGWSGLPETMPEEDVVVKGMFEINSYKVIYIISNSVYFTDMVEYGSPITPPDSPTQPGYSFKGWNGIPATMPAEDVIVVGTFEANDVCFDKQGIEYELNTDKNAYVISDVSNTLYSDVIIPDEANGLPVTAVKEKAFMGAGELQRIVIPSGITTVGDRAFYGCTNLLVVEWNSTAPVSAGCFDTPLNHGNMLVVVSDSDTEVTYNGNVVIDGKAEKIVLTGDMPFRNPRAFTAHSVTCTHEFAKRTKIGQASGWEALVLPFDVETIMSEKKGTLLPFGQADFTTSLPYWAAALQTDGTFAIVESIKANTPFIMEVPNGEEYEDRYNIEGMVTFSATDVTVQATTNSQQPSGNGYSLLATYEGLASSGGVYALNNEDYTAADGSSYLPGGVFVAGSRDIRPFEAYVYSESGSRAPYLRIGGKEGTGIGAATVTDENDAWYTLQGIRLSGKPQERGVYIHNGRKVVVK